MNTGKLFFSALSVCALAGAANAQAWCMECIDPANEAPYSTDWATNGTGNSLIEFGIGVSGTVTYGSTSGPCYSTARTLNAPGRFALSIGNVGSVQTTFDNGMGLTVGAPCDPAGDYCFTRIYKGSDSVLFGDGGLNVVFSGLSKRYVKAVWRDGEVEADLTVRVIGDAVRYDWKLRNLTTDSLDLGMRFGAYPGMFSNGSDNHGHNQSLSTLNTLSGNVHFANAANGPYIGHIETPTVKPPRSEKCWLRSNPRFPDWVKFNFAQSNPYGMRIDNVSTEATPDATPTDHMTIGNHGIALWDNNMRGRVFTDPAGGEPGIDADIDEPREDSDTLLTQVSFIQTWTPAPVAAGSIRNIIHYVRSTWSNGDYLDPYSVVVDAPRLVESRPGLGLNDLSPNPMRVVAYIDNQYADLDKDVTLSNVRIRINITPGSGIRLAAGESEEKVLATVTPNQIRNVEWQLEADGTTVGTIPYTVTFSPTPGPVKTINGSILVSAVPRLRMAEGASLFTVPWNFADTSWDAVFGPVGDPNALKFGQDYVAYRWDPALNTYQPTTTANRGDSYWIVAKSDQGYRQLQGALLPTDSENGGLMTTLQPGWNMIGNPYSIPIPLAHITGVGQSDPLSSITWSELVQNGWVSPSLAYWERSEADPMTGTYKFTEGDVDMLAPQRGYWVYVSTFEPIRLVWPPVFTPGVSTTNRTAAGSWKQSDKQWRLQLMARTASGQDVNNFIGIASSAANANKLRIFEPPAAPEANVQLAIDDIVNGKPTRLAQSLADRPGKRTWNVVASAAEAGEVTISWPNINSVPKNVRVKLIDTATNTSRDMRFSSSYTFRMDQPGQRAFKVEVEPAGASRALIGNVTVSRPSRAPGAPVTINYALSSSAVTTIRILSGTGKEVFMVSRGRSVDAGENSATWSLRDNANRAVAPGTYQVEILAETQNGDRVRKVVPVNIVR